MKQAWLRATSMTGRLRRDRRGLSLVELALVVPLLAMFAMTIADVGMGFYYKTQLMTAAEVGAQYAMNNRDSFDKSGISGAIVNATGLSIDTADIAANLSCKCINADGRTYTASLPAPDPNSTDVKQCAASSRSDCPGASAPTQKPGAYVTVTITPSCAANRCYRPLFNYLGFGTAYALSATSMVRVQ